MAKLKPVHQLTSAQFDRLFPEGDEDACKAYLKARRWPEGVHCPRCGNPKVYDLKSRQWHWQCEQCAPDGYRFSIIAGTIFENTNKPLRDWFKVAHLMLTSKKGMSARQLCATWASARSKPLGTWPTKSAPRSLRRIWTSLGALSRSMKATSAAKPSTSTARTAASVAAIGLRAKLRSSVPCSRKGNVVARVLISRHHSEAAENFVREMVSNKVSLLATDESKVYHWLTDYTHQDRAAHRQTIRCRRGPYQHD
jgi:hypothetical protein